MNNIIQGPALDKLKELDSNSIDLIVTDPPYGYSFMNKDWDKAVVGVDTWKECLRVLKAGAFAFIMSSPRQDVLCKMILNLIEAGFETNFSSIYWTYASGFPKAADVSKLVDKRNGKPRPVRSIELEDYLKAKIKERYTSHHILAKEMGIDESCIRRWTGKHLDYSVSAFIPPEERYKTLKEKLDLDDRFDELIEREEAEREIIAQKTKARSEGANFAMPTMGALTKYIDIDITKPATQQAKKLEGAYAGFQPKPAVEIILVVMKPLSEKTFVDQALANGKGVTWLDDVRIPYQNEADKFETHTATCLAKDKYFSQGEQTVIEKQANDKGRFPANLLVSDDVLNDGKITKSTGGFVGGEMGGNVYGKYEKIIRSGSGGYGDSGSYSRYFDLDSWAKTYPFLVCPKASKAEKNKGLNCYITVKLSNDECLTKEGNTAAVLLLGKVTSDMGLLSFSTGESGESITAQFQKGSLSTILTAINKIIESRILNSLMHSLTNEYTQDVNLMLMENGKSHVVSAENLKQYLLTITNGSTELALGVSRVVLKMLQKINAREGLNDYNNSHATVKSIKLMSYLITMGSREGDTVLDPFCGSGTTLIAAHELHRKWIGIELDSEYVAIVKKRLQPHIEQTRLY